MAASKQQPTKPEGHAFASINDVPEPWRELNGGRLSLRQINHIYSRAYELGKGVEMVPGEPPVFQPAYGCARNEFRDGHDLENGLWVPKP